MSVSLIAALDEDGLIGRDGALPWRLPADLRRFRHLTLGHAIIMGRRTFESIGRPLDERRNLVLSRRTKRIEGVEVFDSLEAALAAVADDPEPFVIGGAALYAAALRRATRIHRTLVHAEPEGDAFFPEVDWSEWRRVFEERREADSRHAHAFTFETWERAAP